MALESGMGIMNPIALTFCLILTVEMYSGSEVTESIMTEAKKGMTPAVELLLIDDLEGEDYEMLGQSCEWLGDINGDGYDDFLISSRGFHELMLYLGGPRPFDSLPKIILPNHGTITGSRSFSPVNVGDIDDDGVTDFISLFGNDDTLKLFLGLEILDANDYMVLFADSSSPWVFHVDGGGDNNNDTRPDIWVYRYSRFEDTIYGYWGAEMLDSVPDHKIIRSRDPDNQYFVLGRQICSTCDLNGDSIPDIIYGQPTSYEPYPGRVCIVWGGEDLSAGPDLIFYAPRAEAEYPRFGLDMACMGDVNGDGLDDLWICQITRNYIYYGGRPFDTIPDVALDNPFMYGDVENAGDVNNDGYNDAVMAYDAYLYSYLSYIYCYPEMDTLVDAVFSDADFVDALGIGPVTHLGIDYSRGGDVNGDGLNDILISAHKWGDGGTDEGRFFIQSGWDDPTSVDEEDGQPLPRQLQLSQNYPNPFNPATAISFTIPRTDHVRVDIFDILGRLVATVHDGTLPAGEHTVVWTGIDDSGNAAASGIYLYRVRFGDADLTRKMVLVK